MKWRSFLHDFTCLLDSRNMRLRCLGSKRMNLHGDVSKRELLFRLIGVTWGVGLVAIALKWESYFEKWVWFPMFPNFWDAWFIAVGGGLLLLWNLCLEVR